MIVTGLGLGVGFVRGILKTTPQITKDSVHSKGYITTIYDNKGSTIKTLSNHDSNRIYTPLSSIPKNLQHAFIAIEDERYYSHNGIDLYGIIRATFLGIRNQSLSQGGSTITQQLIKNNVLGIQPEKTTMERLETDDVEEIISKISEESPYKRRPTQKRTWMTVPEMGAEGWYAPGMNTHRTAFGARNYEYFSEDGVLAGNMGAKAVYGQDRAIWN